jgi:hypothetical protein
MYMVLFIMLITNIMFMLLSVWPVLLGKALLLSAFVVSQFFQMVVFLQNHKNWQKNTIYTYRVSQKSWRFFDGLYLRNP